MCRLIGHRHRFERFGLPATLPASDRRATLRLIAIACFAGRPECTSSLMLREITALLLPFFNGIELSNTPDIACLANAAGAEASSHNDTCGDRHDDMQQNHQPSRPGRRHRGTCAVRLTAVEAGYRPSANRASQAPWLTASVCSLRID